MATTAPVEFETAAAARRESQAPEAFQPLRHLLLPDLHHRRRRHARTGRVERRRGPHLASRARRALLRSVCVPHRRTRRRVHRRGWRVRVDAPGVGALRRLHQRRLLLVLEPGLDRRRARPADDRGRQHLLLRHLDRRLHLVCRRPRVHLVQRLVGDPLVRYRQVDPDAGGVVPDVPARRLHDRSADLRDLKRAEPAGGRRLLAELRPLHRPRPAALLQLRGLRAPERRGRRDEGPAEGRAGDGAARLRDGDPDVRPAHPRHRVRPAEVADHRGGRLHGRSQGRLDPLRRT